MFYSNFILKKLFITPKAYIFSFEMYQVFLFVIDNHKFQILGSKLFCKLLNLN